jgi:carbon storage regulator
MLVFRRQQGESFRIGDAVEVRILHVGKHYVKIGVIAPREVEILRTELAQLNRQAMLSNWATTNVEETLRDLAGRIRKQPKK